MKIPHPILELRIPRNGLRILVFLVRDDFGWLPGDYSLCQLSAHQRELLAHRKAFSQLFALHTGRQHTSCAVSRIKQCKLTKWSCRIFWHLSGSQVTIYIFTTNDLSHTSLGSNAHNSSGRSSTLLISLKRLSNRSKKCHPACAVIRLLDAPSPIHYTPLRRPGTSQPACRITACTSPQTGQCQGEMA